MTRKQLNIAAWVAIPLLIIAILSMPRLVHPWLIIPAAEASGGPVGASRESIPVSTCSNAAKAGMVELRPNGTMNAMTQVTLTVPFCSGGLVAFATVDNGNTAGEATGAKPFGLTHVNVSMQLDAPSDDVYLVYWEVKKATQ